MIGKYIRHGTKALMPTSTFKRKRNYQTPKYLRRPAKKAKKTRFAGRAGIQRVVAKMINRKIETKMSSRNLPGTIHVAHNFFVILEDPSTFFNTTQGTGDPMIGAGQRIGDEITVKGVMFKMMLELDIRYSDVTARLMIVKSAKGDVPTRSTLFAGLSGNKMIDTINRERYTIVAQKYVKLKASNTGTYGPEIGSVIPLVPNYGFNRVMDADVIQSRTTKIVKLYVPGAKFGRNGLLKYENASTFQTKFFDYTLVVYAYSNQSTNQDIVDVMRVNDFLKQIYYTDA